MEFSKTLGNIEQVTQTVTHGEGVKLGYFEGESEGVGFKPFCAAGVAFGCRTPSCDRKLLHSKVCPGYLTLIAHSPGQQQGQITTTAAHIEHVHPLLRTVATLDGMQTLTFEATPEGIRDVETGSTWTLFGEAVAGPLAGQHLDRIAHHDVFWFVWSAFQPDGDLWRPAR